MPLERQPQVELVDLGRRLDACLLRAVNGDEGDPSGSTTPVEGKVLLKVDEGVIVVLDGTVVSDGRSNLHDLREHPERERHPKGSVRVEGGKASLKRRTSWRSRRA